MTSSFKKLIHFTTALAFLLQQVIPYSPAFAMDKEEESLGRDSSGISYSRGLDDDYPETFQENDDDDDLSGSEDSKGLSRQLNAPPPAIREEQTTSSTSTTTTTSSSSSSSSSFSRATLVTGEEQESPSVQSSTISLT